MYIAYDAQCLPALFEALGAWGHWAMGSDESEMIWGHTVMSVALNASWSLGNQWGWAPKFLLSYFFLQFQLRKKWMPVKKLQEYTIPSIPALAAQTVAHTRTWHESWSLALLLVLQNTGNMMVMLRFEVLSVQDERENHHNRYCQCSIMCASLLMCNAKWLSGCTEFYHPCWIWTHISRATLLLYLSRRPQICIDF